VQVAGVERGEDDLRHGGYKLSAAVAMQSGKILRFACRPPDAVLH
jgi:hypothetical protein